MNDQKPKLLDNKFYVILLSAGVLVLCGYIPNSALVSLQSQPSFSSTYGWIGNVITALISLGLVGFGFQKNKKDATYENNDFWGILLTAVGLPTTYFWARLYLYARFGMPANDSGEHGAMVLILGCIPLLVIFPLLAIRLASMPQKRTVWWWIGLFLNFAVPIVALVVSLTT